MGRYRGQQHPVFGPGATFAKVFRMFGFREEAPEPRVGNMAARRGGRVVAKRMRRRAMAKRSRKINRAA